MRKTFTFVLSLLAFSAFAAEEAQFPDPNQWYVLTSAAVSGDPQYHSVMAVLSADTNDRLNASSTANANAQEYRLWQQAPVLDGQYTDNQKWKFVEDPANPGSYAMICKAYPDGSVNPVPTQLNP